MRRSVRTVTLMIAVLAPVLISACSSGSPKPATTVTVTSAPKSSGRIAGYGQQARTVAHNLKSCASIKAYGSAIRCNSIDGGRASIVTFDKESTETMTIAIMKDQSPTDCAVILDGVIIGASDETSLTAVVGIPEQFAHDQGGYVLCPVGG